MGGTGGNRKNGKFCAFKPPLPSNHSGEAEIDHFCILLLVSIKKGINHFCKRFFGQF